MVVICFNKSRFNQQQWGGGGGGGGGGETRPGTQKRCSHNLQSGPLDSGFKKRWENFSQQLVQ